MSVCRVKQVFGRVIARSLRRSNPDRTLTKNSSGLLRFARNDSVLLNVRNFIKDSRILLLILISVSTSTYANWTDILLTADQQGANLLQKQQYSQAADRFEDPLWKGVAYYRAGNYQAAIKLFEKQDSTLAYYNKGNSLAKLGQYVEAIEAYKYALKKDPSHVDAQHNKSLLEDLLKQQKKQNQDQDQDQKQNSNKDSEQSQNQKDKDSSNDKQQQQQNKSSSQQQPQKNSPSTESRQPDKSEAESESKSDEQKEKKEQQKNKQVKNKQDMLPQQSSSVTTKIEKASPEDQQLKQVPDDPGELLKQKILRDHLLKQNKNGNYSVD